MKVLVTGACGQLGFDVTTELKSRGIEVIAADTLTFTEELPRENYLKVDITDAAAVNDAILRWKPDAVIHCAAWTNVDAAEVPDNREKVFAINVDGTRNIALACKAINCKLLYISTDYVFDGTGTEPWDPDCKAYAPLNFYGESKLTGELAVAETLEKFFIVRIAWVFGKNGRNFVKTMLRLGETHSELRVVNDQIGTPTYTHDLARLLIDMAQTERYGYYHATNEGGFISWYDFACAIMQKTGLPAKVIPVSTEEYGISLAKRPYNSRLSKDKLTEQGFERLPDWQDALDRYLAEIGEIAE